MTNNQDDGGNIDRAVHVEFTVQAEEDLYNPDDSENRICKVPAENEYQCLMLRIQRFGSLFRHYARYKVLREEYLEYYFDNNRLDVKDTPNSVQLQWGDTIIVRTRQNNPEPSEPTA